MRVRVFVFVCERVQHTKIPGMHEGHLEDAKKILSNRLSSQATRNTTKGCVRGRTQAPANTEKTRMCAGGMFDPVLCIMLSIRVAYLISLKEECHDQSMRRPDFHAIVHPIPASCAPVHVQTGVR